MCKIALIAHDNKKTELIEFVSKYRGFFANKTLVATDGTGAVLRTRGFEVELVPHGPCGGDIVIGAMICKKEIAAVFFLRDLMTAQPHEPDVTALLRMCDIYNVPLATNEATAICLVNALCDVNKEFC